MGSAIASDAQAPVSAGWPSLEKMISTGDEWVDRACALAVRTLKMNVSEKWGRLCPVLAPPWGRHYPAWVHPFDNFWMNKVTSYLHPKDQVEWPVILFSKYQRPTGMIGWGVHGPVSPEAAQAQFAADMEKVRQESVGSRYIRDHLYIMQVHDLWWHYGDAELARRLLPSCKKALDYLYSLKDEDRDGLIESAAILEDIDIGSTKEISGPNAAERFVDQALLYGALSAYAGLAEGLGEASEAALARERASALARKVNELYWNDKGYYIYALNSKTHEPLYPEVTSTYPNGYAILWGLVPPERIPKLLSYLTSWEFEVPGPILIPPLTVRMSHIGHSAGERNYPPGVYVNGGCGWGRGHMPSVCLALFAHGREALAFDYIRKMARAANRAGSFYEYWTWEKYTGATKPGGCPDYAETASAFLDSVIHGYFGMAALEPGWKSLRFAPKPVPGTNCSISLDLPGGPFTAALRREGAQWRADLTSAVARRVEFRAPGGGSRQITLQGSQTLRLPATGSRRGTPERYQFA